MRRIFSLASIVFLVFLSGHAWAANYSDPIDGIFRGIYGDMITVEVPSQVSKSPVTSDNQNGDLSFQLNAGTHYSNFNQLTDLKHGDPVRVEYREDPSGKTKQMIASVITKLEPEVVTNSTDINGVNAVPAPASVTQTVITTTSTKVNPQ